MIEWVKRLAHGLANSAANGAERIADGIDSGLVKLIEKFDARLFHDLDTPHFIPAIDLEPLNTLPLPVLPTESDYLNGQPTVFEGQLANLICLNGTKDNCDLIEYFHQCLNAWGRA